jgi:hypothetical protein
MPRANAGRRAVSLSLDGRGPGVRVFGEGRPAMSLSDGRTARPELAKVPAVSLSNRRTSRQRPRRDTIRPRQSHRRRPRSRHPRTRRAAQPHRDLQSRSIGPDRRFRVHVRYNFGAGIGGPECQAGEPSYNFARPALEVRWVAACPLDSIGRGAIRAERRNHAVEIPTRLEV